MKLGTLLQLQLALAGQQPGETPVISQTYACAVKKAAGMGGTRLFDVDAVVSWCQHHKDFKITDVYPKKKARLEPPGPTSNQPPTAFVQSSRWQTNSLRGPIGVLSMSENPVNGDRAELGKPGPPIGRTRYSAIKRVRRKAGHRTRRPNTRPRSSGAKQPGTQAEWQDAVDAAEGALCLDSARQYGLVTGAPEVNVERAAFLLREGKRRGITPAPDAVERFVAGCVVPSRQQSQR